MYESDLSEDSVDNADDLVIGCSHEHADCGIPLGNSHLIASNDFPRKEQIAREFTEFADKYRLNCSEDMSQSQPSVIGGEKHPSWLIEHLDGIKDTVEKELTDLHGDFDTPFELNYDESVEEREMEAIRKMEEEKEDDQQNTHRKSVPIYPGSRLTIGISALLVMAVVIRHSLTGQALNDILKLIWLHCSGSSEFLRSINELKKCFCDISSLMKFHWYCSFCFMLVDKNKDKCCPKTLLSLAV